MRNTLGNHQGKAENVGQHVSEKQLHTEAQEHLNQSSKGGRERCFQMSWHRSASGLCQILGVHHPPNDLPERNQMCFCSVHTTADR